MCWQGKRELLTEIQRGREPRKRKLVEPSKVKERPEYDVPHQHGGTDDDAVAQLGQRVDNLQGNLTAQLTLLNAKVPRLADSLILSALAHRSRRAYTLLRPDDDCASSCAPPRYCN